MFAVILGCCALAACGKVDLYSKLTETQANEMVAVLQSAGISAAKKDNGETGWSIAASNGDFSKAVEVLHAQGYPREEFASLGTVFKKEGFVSSPTEERARLIYGLSQELAHTISEIDGVTQARVHLAIPPDQRLGEAPQPSSASVFIKYRPGVDIDSQLGKVKSLVVNSIEGLKVENVSVTAFPSQPLPGARVGSADGPTLAGFGFLAALGLLLLLGAVSYPAFRRWQQRKTAIVRSDQG
jgi:type III secretion protein J